MIHFYILYFITDPFFDLLLESSQVLAVRRSSSDDSSVRVILVLVSANSRFSFKLWLSLFVGR